MKFESFANDQFYSERFGGAISAGLQLFKCALGERVLEGFQILLNIGN
jgi:hypothetical protein